LFREGRLRSAAKNKLTDRGWLTARFRKESMSPSGRKRLFNDSAISMRPYAFDRVVWFALPVHDPPFQFERAGARNIEVAVPRVVDQAEIGLQRRQRFFVIAACLALPEGECG